MFRIIYDRRVMLPDFLIRLSWTGGACSVIVCPGGGKFVLPWAGIVKRS